MLVVSEDAETEADRLASMCRTARIDHIQGEIRFLARSERAKEPAPQHLERGAVRNRVVELVDKPFSIEASKEREVIKHECIYECVGHNFLLRQIAKCYVLRNLIRNPVSPSWTTPRDPEKAKAHALSAGWFLPGEIVGLGQI